MRGDSQLLQPHAGVCGAAVQLFGSRMREMLRKTDIAVNALGGKIVPIGILPTLREADMAPSALTDLPRYRALSAEVRRARSSPFAIRIDGQEPLSITAPDIALEGADTSLQIHLRVPPASTLIRSLPG